MDHELTKQIGAWLEKPASERDLQAGALLVLRLSNNRIMYNNFMRNLKRSAKMIEYQLQKYYNFRIKDLTHQQVVDMQKQVEKIVKTDHLNLPAPQSGAAPEPDSSAAPSVEEIRKGKRPDHDSLPAEIKALYVENLSILQRMRNTHAKLELLSVENVTCPDSERYPFLKELIELDKKYHENWFAYDHFELSASAPSGQDSADSQSGSPTQPDGCDGESGGTTRPDSAPADSAAPAEGAEAPMGSPTQPDGCDGESGSTTRPDGDGVASQSEVVAEREEPAPKVKPKRTTRKTTKK